LGKNIGILKYFKIRLFHATAIILLVPDCYVLFPKINRPESIPENFSKLEIKYFDTSCTEEYISQIK
jgi:hypothetical protein